MKKYVIILLLASVLFSCGKTDINENTNSGSTFKTPFYIETKTIQDFSSDVLFKKSAKLVSTSEVNVKSQASGKISKLNFKLGDRVNAGQTLVVLEDNISNYYTSLERAKNALERAKINYDSTLLTLDKTISDLQINYEKSLKNHELLILDIDERLKKAHSDYSESQVEVTDSKTNLDLSKLEQDLQKAKLDYENGLLNDNNQITSYIENIKSNYKSLSLTYFDSINFLDELFGVTDKNKYKNDSFELYLSAKDTSVKTQVENDLRKIISDYDIFKNKDLSLLSEKNVGEYISTLESTYTNLRNILNLSKDAIKSSVESSNFSQTTIDMYFNTTTNYSNGISSSYNQFITLKNNTNSFLNTYKQNQSSRLEAINILQKQIEISYKQAQINEGSYKTSLSRTQIDADNTIINSEIGLKTAKNNLENAIKNKEITLKSLQNAIKESEISLSESQKNAGKLIITAPISGIISKKSVDVGMELSMGSDVITMVGDNMTKVEVYLSKEEVSLIGVGDRVKVNYFNNDISGKIESISSVASKDFTYLTTIHIFDRVEMIGDFVEINFLSKSDNILLPVSVVKISGNNTASVNIFSTGSEIIAREIIIGKIYRNEVEVISGLTHQDEIILTDIKNYKENDFELVKR